MLIYNTETSEKIEITDIRLQKSSRLLVNDGYILVTGGCKYLLQSFQINSGDFSILDLKPMNFSRFWHSMGHIDGFPAVIGGCTIDQSTRINIKSVEIYKHGS